MTAQDKHAAIVEELYQALEDLGAEPELLGTIRAWGQELSDQEVLEHVKRFRGNFDSPVDAIEAFAPVPCAFLSIPPKHLQETFMEAFSHIHPFKPDVSTALE